VSAHFQDGKGSILEADVEALVNPVNCVGVMGKGLALAFKRKFPAVFREYARACAAGEVVLGRVQVVETKAKSRTKFIVNFPTKNHWRGESRVEDITTGLADLLKQVRARHIRSIAVPALGCGLGGLTWSAVRPVIQQAFTQANEDVLVLLFAPMD
jgi:O-acetyl-ADP-ribose deacetylase (regulator of RNase III)